ncbi:fatty acid desaturase family protein [Streptomyces sp. NPDC014685]|uniref:fatty acid desaturase family protein n=1 Tax=Streptomyces sp. NPDC014685 TaxID=3364881 RepID=UPI0036FB55C9
MRIWKHTPKDALLLGYSLAQPVLTVWVAAQWHSSPVWAGVGGGLLVAVMTAYNIIVVSHLFTHVPWFASAGLNAVGSLLNSANIGQSVQAYHLTHVRNHHRFNNDPVGEDGTTRDTSSTYRDGRDGEHAPLGRYILLGALETFADRVRDVLRAHRLWRVGPDEHKLLSLAHNREPRRTRELRQIQADRAAHCLALAGLLWISWQWTLLVYLPACFVALVLVNVQNYFRHYGADPLDRTTDSVSYYGTFYNRIAFNDGYHQEHHLSPASHWSQLPDVRARRLEGVAPGARIISPVPAVLGFLHRDRPLLHRREAGGTP